MTFSSLGHLLPELILLTGACALLIVGLTRFAKTPSALSLLAGGMIAGALVATLLIGIPAEVGDLPGLALSPLTFYVRWLTLTVGLLLILLNWRQAEPSEQGEYLALILFAMLGILLTASASDVVVLFFAIELVSVPTYILVALSRRDVRASEAAVKYFFLGALSAALLAYGLGFLYGASGTTSLASMAGVWASRLQPASIAGADMLVLIGFLLAFAGLSFKIAAVPFHAYVADVYEGAASPVTALLGFVPKLAGFIALIRIMETVHWQLPASVMWLIWIVAALTMTVGNVLGLLQTNVKRMLAYSSIAHSGYLLLALLVGPALGAGPMSNGVTALLFYIAVYGVMNLGAFAALSSFQRGDRTLETLDDLSGLARSQPWPALALSVCAFSLMGFPPTAGFLGKLYIFSGAFSLAPDHAFRMPLIVLAVIGVINSAIGAAYYLRIVGACWMNRPREEVASVPGMTERLGLNIAGLAMLVLFVAPGPLLTKARIGAASQARSRSSSIATAVDPGPRGSATSAETSLAAHEP
ncbi:MAG: NADH-quinone oxidoreductase subunit N [Phycisphaerales bacterium]|nr:NADH-quinone oxidoreductase subunit N [Phycisphaerales bacterium]